MKLIVEVSALVIDDNDKPSDAAAEGEEGEEEGEKKKQSRGKLCISHSWY
jgi:hypothetical protein